MNVLTAELNIMCNGCGELMQDMGQWPIRFPRLNGHVLHSRRFSCRTCRTPSAEYAKGYPVMIAIAHDGESK